MTIELTRNRLLICFTTLLFFFSDILKSKLEGRELTLDFLQQTIQDMLLVIPHLFFWLGWVWLGGLFVYWAIKDTLKANRDKHDKLERATVAANLAADLANRTIEKNKLALTKEDLKDILTPDEWKFYKNYQFRDDVSIQRPLTSYPKELNDKIEKIVNEYYKNQD